MKIYLFLQIISTLMLPESIDLELIGRHINEVSDSTILLEDESSLKWKIYRVDGEFQFLGKTYNSLFIRTNENDIIKSLNIHLDGVIGRSFFDLMIEEYGYPNFIYKTDEFVSTEKNEGNEIVSKSRRGILKECTFEDDPFLIIWNQKKIKIYVDLGYEGNPFRSTTISFSNEVF